MASPGSAAAGFPNIFLKILHARDDELEPELSSDFFADLSHLPQILVGVSQPRVVVANKVSRRRIFYHRNIFFGRSRVLWMQPNSKWRHGTTNSGFANDYGRTHFLALNASYRSGDR